ncbi:hypothetical protein DUNSADRAFT_7779 [Dunaliella salina]|uniref:PiggyBac transposable element-derived protein domain-containing protein n=1 Tax=Dunaliella salina TaxID=3046 RepID=A0ABQ7GKR0_DUNSA|nr:hypothetical protein DUNSADRAFT_7779 [Dunaliella salina]|eukprot:KAF5835189.1 hypothetical protein DUNSADRAFT_7779 [Dunaliella salina]
MWEHVFMCFFALTEGLIDTFTTRKTWKDLSVCSQIHHRAAVAQRYMDWFRSRPFDVGNTCRLAFSACSPSEVPGRAAQFNTTSEANGVLMRAAPIALWCVKHGMPYTTVAAHARADSRLSHCSKVRPGEAAPFTLSVS